MPSVALMKTLGERETNFSHCRCLEFPYQLSALGKRNVWNVWNGIHWEEFRAFHRQKMDLWATVVTRDNNHHSCLHLLLVELLKNEGDIGLIGGATVHLY